MCRPDSSTVPAASLDRGRTHRLLTELPEVVHLPAPVGADRSLRAAVELLGMELEEREPGSKREYGRAPGRYRRRA